MKHYAATQLLMLALVVAVAACTADQKRALTVLECKARVLAPYVDDNAEAVVLQVEAGQVDPAVILQRLDTAPAEIIEAAFAYRECSNPIEPQ